MYTYSYADVSMSGNKDISCFVTVVNGFLCECGRCQECVHKHLLARARSDGSLWPLILDRTSLREGKLGESERKEGEIETRGRGRERRRRKGEGEREGSGEREREREREREEERVIIKTGRNTCSLFNNALRMEYCFNSSTLQPYLDIRPSYTGHMHVNHAT